jgi:hypothetical protein
MLVWSHPRVIVEEPRRNFEPVAFRNGRGNRTAAVGTEGGVIGGWVIQNRCGISSDEITSGKETIVFGVHANHEESGATGNFSATVAVAKLHWTNGLVNLKRDAAAKTTPS